MIIFDKKDKILKALDSFTEDEITKEPEWMSVEKNTKKIRLCLNGLVAKTLRPNRYIHHISWIAEDYLGTDYFMQLNEIHNAYCSKNLDFAEAIQETKEIIKRLED